MTSLHYKTIGIFVGILLIFIFLMVNPSTFFITLAILVSGLIPIYQAFIILKDEGSELND